MTKIKTEPSENINGIKPVVKSSLREDALEWFFAKSENEKEELKDKYFASEYIAHDSQWGYHFTFGQIEEMYVKDKK